MITVFERRRFPNWWTTHPDFDPRFRGLLDLSKGIAYVFDFASGDSDDDLVLTPSELAACLREAAEQIEMWTDNSAPLD